MHPPASTATTWRIALSRKRRTFTPRFKSDLVIEALKGEKELSVLAAENRIKPGLLRAWKSEFIEKAPVIFDAAREDTAREKLESERKKTASLEKMIGKLTMKVEFLKKKSSELLGPDYASQYGPCPFDEE